MPSKDTEKRREWNRKWNQNNAEKRRELNRKWREEHPEYNRQHYENNSEQRKEYQKEWGKNNPAKVNAKSGRRRARKLNQTPELTDREKLEIDFLYAVADGLGQITGTPYEVDHIHPLSKGGIHHPRNLQVITEKENLRKSAKIIIT